jgi:hypothetical protein
MKQINVIPQGFPCTIEECPVGLFLSGDELVVKTEYRSNNRPDAYIVSSGEYYCGSGLVQPCIIQKDFGTAWNQRMNELGAERGTISDLLSI